MRHTINLYVPYENGHKDENWGWTTMGVCTLAFIGGLWGLIALADPAVANSFGWALVSLLPLGVHVLLNMTSVYFGVTLRQGRVLETWKSMPKELRQNIPVPRDEVKRLDAADCLSLENKMEKAMALRQQRTGRINEAHRYLDSAIEQYKDSELEGRY